MQRRKTMKHHAKVITAAILAALLAVSCTVALAATAEEVSMPEDSASEGNVPVAESEENEKVAENLGAVADAVVGIVTDNDLDITAADHIYKAEKLLLVTVGNKNETKAYSIDVTVTYYGVDNEILGKETQSFDQLAAGFSWNFIFRPGYDFVDYKLETAKTAYNGELWKTYITDTELINYYGNLSVGFFNNRDKVMIGTKFRIVVFDQNGEIIDILHKDALIGAAANSHRSNGLPFGECPEECAVAGCDDEHIANWKQIEVGSTFITHEVVLPEAHPCYDEWMSYAHLPGNVFASNLK